MGQREILLTISRLLKKHGISYLLTGGFAASYFGYPRATHDIDFVLEIDIKNYPKLEKVLKELNRSFLIDWHQVEEGIKRYLHFNILHLDSGIKIDFWPARKNEFNASRFKRKKESILYNKKICLISPEDLILTKLLWCKEVKSEKHLRDCIGIWNVQQGKLDIEYLHSWAKKLAVEDLLEEIKKEKY